MNKLFSRWYALTSEGVKDFKKSIFWTTLVDISFMLTSLITFRFLQSYLRPMFNLGDSNIESFGYYLIMFGIAFLIIFVLSYIQYGSTYGKTYTESAKTRINLAEHLRRLPLSYFDKKDISDLSATIMEDATEIESLFSHSVPQIYASLISTIIIGILIAIYDWRMALATFWVVPIALLIFFLSRRKQKKDTEKSFKAKRRISDEMQESIDSIQEIVSYNREDYYNDRLNKSIEGYRKSEVEMELIGGVLINISYSVLKLGLVSVAIVGAFLLASSSISAFTYIVFLILSAKIYEPIIDTINNLAAFNFLSVRIDRIHEMNDMPIQVGSSKFNPKYFDIEFKNVSFSYEEDETTIKDISFIAKQGEVTALIGPSGCGKTTVTKLAARFWDVDEGVITLGGIDVSKIEPETLLKYYSIVFQDVVLFNTSIKENIKLGRSDASDEEVLKAGSLAQCDEFVKGLEEGYDTAVGENGAKLSGGERQRISIARAILKDAPIILLDEATASIDAENESKIQMAISSLVENKTVLIIAHRMRTISEADKIVKMKEGRIVS